MYSQQDILKGAETLKYNKNNKPIVCYQTQSKCYKNTYKMNVKGVLWHSTGANNPYIKRYVQPSDNAKDKEKMLALLGVNKNKNDWNHIVRSAGMNCFIGKLADGTVSTIQTMPWNYRPWGCGSGNKGSCNSGWIQFEICEDSLDDRKYFEAVYKEAVEITAYLCEMYNINPQAKVKHNGVNVPTILCHADSFKLGLGNNHGDVYNWFNRYGKTMDDVRRDVAALLGENKQESKYNPSVKEWQVAAVADGFKLTIDGKWNSADETIARKAVVKKRDTYRYHNLTKIVQKVVGVETDGKCGKDTEAAIKKWQAANALTVDGAIGINGWRTMINGANKS